MCYHGNSSQGRPSTCCNKGYDEGLQPGWRFRRPGAGVPGSRRGRDGRKQGNSSPRPIQLLVLGDARMAWALVDCLATLGIPCGLTQSELGVSSLAGGRAAPRPGPAGGEALPAEPNHPRYMKPPGSPAGPTPASTTARG